jgi:hypothetical protein
VSYPYDRAYQRFLNSLLSYRTFPSLAPGYGGFGAVAPDSQGVLWTPYGYQGGSLDAAPAPSWGYGPPAMSPNFARAYRHFVNSPYSYRTLSSWTPGYVTSFSAPYSPSFQWTFVDPAYTHLRITPYGFEGYSVTPGSRTYTIGPAWFMPTYPGP